MKPFLKLIVVSLSAQCHCDYVARTATCTCQNLDRDVDSAHVSDIFALVLENFVSEPQVLLDACVWQQCIPMVVCASLFCMLLGTTPMGTNLLVSDGHPFTR